VVATYVPPEDDDESDDEEDGMPAWMISVFVVGGVVVVAVLFFISSRKGNSSNNNVGTRTVNLTTTSNWNEEGNDPDLVVGHNTFNTIISPHQPQVAPVGYGQSPLHTTNMSDGAPLMTMPNQPPPQYEDSINKFNFFYH